MEKNGRVALITGTSSGIGEACYKHLVQKGYTVFGTSRLAEHPENLLSKMNKSDHFISNQIIRMDVNSDSSVNQAIEYILGITGKIDIVINNAGVSLVGSVEDTSIEEAKSLFETNFWGITRVSKAVLPAMRKQGFGYIVNMSSIMGLIALPFQAFYVASKFAVEGMTEALRMEVRRFGIHIILIEPGDCNTEITKNRIYTLKSQQESVYSRTFANVMKIVRHNEMHGCSPKRIANLLEHIINHPSPKLRYKIGGRFELAATVVKKFIPSKIFESLALMRYKMKMK